MESGNGHEHEGCAPEPPVLLDDAPLHPPPRADIVTAAAALWAGLWVLVVIGFVYGTVWAVKTIFGWFDIY
jgi:hypothetical protein